MHWYVLHDVYIAYKCLYVAVLVASVGLQLDRSTCVLFSRCFETPARISILLAKSVCCASFKVSRKIRLAEMNDAHILWNEKQLEYFNLFSFQIICGVTDASSGRKRRRCITRIIGCCTTHRSRSRSRCKCCSRSKRCYFIYCPISRSCCCCRKNPIAAPPWSSIRMRGLPPIFPALPG